VCCCNQTAPPDATGPERRDSPPPPPPLEGGNRGAPIEGAARGREHANSLARLDYDITMAVHVAPRRSRCIDEAPDPSGQRSVLVPTFRDEQVRTAAYVEESNDAQSDGRGARAPLPPLAMRATRNTLTRQPAPTQTNAHGRRYVTWGVPHGEYSPPPRKEPRPTVRRGILD
jgi:hypothetical protein